MPVWIDRRRFLLGGAAAVLTSAASRLAAQQGPESPFRIALFSDTHIAADPEDQYRGFFPHRNLKTAVQQAQASAFDLLVVNGDLARQMGRPEDYQQFNQLLGPLLDSVPTMATLGNHDDRKNARSALVKRGGDVQAVQQKLVTALDTPTFHLLFLDSLMVTNIAAGQLGHSQRGWLPQHLDAQGKKPILVFVHHNPDPDNDTALVDAEQFLAIVKPRTAVKAVFFGHTHEYRVTEQSGLQLVNLPAIGYNFSDEYPVGWIQGAFTPAGASLTLRAIGGERSGDGKVTSLHWRA